MYGQLDLQRAAQVYLDFIPAMLMQAGLDVYTKHFKVREIGSMIVYTEREEGKAETISLIYNTETIYASICLDLIQTAARNRKGTGCLTALQQEPEIQLERGTVCGNRRRH